MFSRLLLFFCVGCVASAIPARAALMASYDMASMAHSSSLVVMIKEPEWKEEQGIRRAKCQVLQVFKDSRLDKNEVSALPISMSTLFDRKEFWSTGKDEIKPEKLLLFLEWNERWNSYAPVLSGVKLLAGDKIWAYSQQMNPGPFSPVVQTAELVRLKASQPYDEAALLNDMVLSLEKASRFEQDLRSKPALKRLLSYLKIDRTKSWSPDEDVISQEAARFISDHYDASQWWEFAKVNWGVLGWREKLNLKNAFRAPENFDFLVAQPESSIALPIDSAPDRFSFAPEMRRLFEELKKTDSLQNALQFSPKDAAQVQKSSTRSRELVRLAKNSNFQFSRDDIASLAFMRESRLSKKVLSFATQKFGDKLQNFNSDLPLFHAIVAYYARVKSSEALELLAASTRYMRKGENGTDYTIYQPVIELLQKSYVKDDAHLMRILLPAVLQNPDYVGGATRALIATASEKQAPAVIEMLSATKSNDDAVAFLTLILQIDKTGAPATVEALKKLIADNGNSNQDEAVNIAAYYSDPTLPPLLLKIAQDQKIERYVRADAIEGLGKMNYRPARQIIEKMTPVFKQASASALAFIGTTDSLPFLLPLLDLPFDDSIRAAMAIAKITGQNFGADYSAEVLQGARRWAKTQTTIMTK